MSNCFFMVESHEIIYYQCFVLCHVCATSRKISLTLSRERERRIKQRQRKNSLIYCIFSLYDEPPSQPPRPSCPRWKSYRRQRLRLTPSLWPIPVTWRWGTTLRSTDGWREWQRSPSMTERLRRRNTGWGKEGSVCFQQEELRGTKDLTAAQGTFTTSIHRCDQMWCQQTAQDTLMFTRSTPKEGERLKI